MQKRKWQRSVKLKPAKSIKNEIFSSSCRQSFFVFNTLSMATLAFPLLHFSIFQPAASGFAVAAAANRTYKIETVNPKKLLYKYLYT